MKSLVKSATGAAALLLALTACASSAKTDSAASGQTSSGPTATTGQTTPGSVPSSPATSGASTGGPTTAPTSSVPVQPTGGPGKPTVTNGDQIKYTSPEGVSVSPDNRTLSAPVTWGGCTEQPQLLITEQSSSQVVIELKTITHFKLGAMCPNIARNGEATAVLNAPLGGRAIIDGITHRPVSH